MNSFLYRQLKRLLVLLPVLLIIYFSLHDIYPWLDSYIPNLGAFVITYLLVAYIFLPAGLRLLRILWPPKHLPLYCTTPDGFACDPINIGIVATEKQLVEAMADIGWQPADQKSIPNITKMALAIIFKKHYSRAPFSTLYLFGRRQDYGWQLPVGRSPRRRHHVRFWATSDPLASRHQSHANFWRRHYSPSGQRIFWVGAASRDIGLGFIRHNAQISHRVAADTNRERDKLVASLRKLPEIKHIYTKNITGPYRLQNRVLTSQLHSDGRITICQF